MVQINKYEKEIKLLSISKIVLNENIKIKTLAANGIVMPLPSEKDLVSIIFFLQFDLDENIANIAKRKFYRIPESTILKALKKDLHKYVLIGLFKYLIKQEKQNIEIFKLMIKNPSFDFNFVTKALDKLSIELKTYLAEALSIIILYPKVISFLIKSEIDQSSKQKIIDFVKRNNIKLEDGIEKKFIEDNKNKDLQKDKEEIKKKSLSIIDGIKRLGIKKYGEQIKYPKVKKIILNENIKIKTLASKGIIIPTPTKEELVSTLFFLQADLNEKIAETAKEKFYTLPEVTILETLKGELHKFVLAGIFNYLIKQEKQNIDILKLIIKNHSFDFNLVLSQLSELTIDLKSYLAQALSLIAHYPKVMSFLLKSDISQSDKQKILDFVKRNNIKLQEIEDEKRRKLEKLEKEKLEKEKLEKEKLEKEKAEKAEKENTSTTLNDQKENTSTTFSDKKEEEKEEVKAEKREYVKEPEIQKSLMRKIKEMNISEKIQLAMKGGMEERGLLIRQSNRLIVDAVIRNPKITDQEILKFSGDKNIAQEVIKFIANNRKWIRKHEVKMNIILNPKTPLGRARVLLTTLRLKEIKKISKMSGISGALKRIASEHVAREEKKKRKKK